MILWLLVCSVQFAVAEPMGTAFTYQGQLYDYNYPANDQYDFQFKLYDADSSGSQIGDDVNVANLDVIKGYFTVTELDFDGASAFNGNARWLEIGIRPGDQDDPNSYTVLSPRQKVTPTPYALQTRGIFVDDSCNVGIGTTSPQAKLDVNSTSSGFLPPRMSGTQLGAIESNVPEGSVAYNTDQNSLVFRDGNGWKTIVGGGCWRHNDGNATTITPPRFYVNGWDEIDLSDVVGKNIAMVMLDVSPTTTGTIIFLRPGGNTDDGWFNASDPSNNGSAHKTLLGAGEHTIVFMETDSNGKIEITANYANRPITYRVMGYIK